MPPQFSIGTILSQTFAVIRAGLGKFVAVALAFVVLWHIPVVIADRSVDEFSWWDFTVTHLGRYLIGGCITAVLVYGTLLMLGGGKPSLSDLLRGLSFVVPVIAISIVTELPIIGGELLQAGNPDQRQILPVQAVLGIGTYILYVLCFAAAPAIVGEGLRTWAALRRSITLTAGKRCPFLG